MKNEQSRVNDAMSLNELFTTILNEKGIGRVKKPGDFTYQDIDALKKMYKTLSANGININFSHRSPFFYRDGQAVAILDIANTKARQIVKMFKTGSGAEKSTTN